MEEKPYYVVNGLSPLTAMKSGLISKDEYRGFLIGNILKYLLRYQYKNMPLGDLDKCKNYLEELIRFVKEEKTVVDGD